VLEINACGIENTFDDEYDTYTSSISVSAPTPVHFTVDFNFCFTSADILPWNHFGDIPETNIYNQYSEKNTAFQPPPIHILHSIWII
jgi:hypothetical protein